MSNFIKILLAVGNICGALVCILREYNEYRIKYGTLGNEKPTDSTKIDDK